MTRYIRSARYTTRHCLRLIAQGRWIDIPTVRTWRTQSRRYA